MGSFHRNRDSFLQKAFEESQFEAANRKFGHHITTDGSVLLTRSKTARELKREEMSKTGVNFEENKPQQTKVWIW